MGRVEAVVRDKKRAERIFDITLHISFPMKGSETKKKARDRLMKALETYCPHYVASWNAPDEKVVKVEDEYGTTKAD